PAQHGEGHVVDGNPAAGGAAQDPAVSVPVDSEIGPQLVEGTGQARRSEKGKDLEWLALQRLPARRVVQERDAVAGAELEERFLQLELLLDAGVDEALDRLLAEFLQLGLLEA